MINENFMKFGELLDNAPFLFLDHNIKNKQISKQLQSEYYLGSTTLSLDAFYKKVGEFILPEKVFSEKKKKLVNISVKSIHSSLRPESKIK